MKSTLVFKAVAICITLKFYKKHIDADLHSWIDSCKTLESQAFAKNLHSSNRCVRSSFETFLAVLVDVVSALNGARYFGRSFTSISLINMFSSENNITVVLGVRPSMMNEGN